MEDDIIGFSFCHVRVSVRDEGRRSIFTRAMEHLLQELLELKERIMGEKVKLNSIIHPPNPAYRIYLSRLYNTNPSQVLHNNASGT